ncbi:hypothetical protein KKG71_05620 [Patescibacteria group bacterium]|nr:hypothetical protein [Patescibacteria group bacterium]
MKILKTLLSIIIPLSIILGSAGIGANAQISLPEKYRPQHAPILKEAGKDFDQSSITYIVLLIMSTLFYAAGGIAIFFVVQSGVKYVLAAGDTGKVDEAKKGLLWSILGFTAILFSYTIIYNVVKWVFRLQET